MTHRDLRARLLLNARRLIGERGAEGLSIEELCVSTSVPGEAFYTVFASRTDCLLALFDEAADQAGLLMIAAYDSAGQWVDGVRGALFALLDFLDRDPLLARFMILGSLTGDPPMLARRTRLLSEIARGFELDRPAVEHGSIPAPFDSEAVVAAVASILHGCLQEGTVSHLREIGGALMGMLVLPYLGVEAARSELTRPMPIVSTNDESGRMLRAGVV